MRTVILAALALVGAASIAEARVRSSIVHPDCNVTMPCLIVAPLGVSSHAARRAARGLRTPRTGFGSVMTPDETQGSFVSGLVPTLSAKLASIQAACPGTYAISGVRHARIAGTRTMSLHSQGKAIDVRGPYGCIYGQLQGWKGGYSTDSGRVAHIHISLDEAGGREMGLRFRHGCGRPCASRAGRSR